METKRQTPQELFGSSVRYIVPLFQRAYVWDREHQWEPLWDDLRDTAARYSATQPSPHFLGAIVLKQLSVLPGEPPRYLVVDGQQRLTTLQLALAGIRDALSQDARAKDVLQAPVQQIESLTRNVVWSQNKPKYRYKVVPFSDPDVQAFEAIIDQEPAPDPNHPMAKCRAYYQEEAAALLKLPDAQESIQGLIHAACNLLQIVSITLDSNENEHLIFETLNARAEPLSEWEKARNLFLAEVADQYNKERETAFYDRYLRRFDTDAWWTKEIYAQRQWGKRVGAFLRYWLEVEHRQAIPPHRVYYWFRRLTRERKAGGKSIHDIAESFVHYAGLFERIEKRPRSKESLEGRFFYRRNILAVGVAVPLLMKLYDRLPAGDEREVCLRAIESWLVRRLLGGYTAMGYDKLFLKLLQRISNLESEEPRAITRTIVDGLQDGFNWPGDAQVVSDIESRPRYPGWHSQARIRMLLEAIESDFIAGAGMAAYPVIPEDLWIEHIMPQSWMEHWRLPAETTQEERDRTILTLGNLTLTSSKLNIHMSNAPWEQKRKALQEHDNLFLNRQLLEQTGSSDWNERTIEARGRELAKSICRIWPHADAL